MEEVKQRAEKLVEECKAHFKKKQSCEGCRWFVEEKTSILTNCWWLEQPCCRGRYPTSWKEFDLIVDFEEVGRILVLVDLGLLRVREEGQ